MIRPLTSNDIEEITRVHLLAFPDAAMSKMGQPIVAHYYRWQFEAPHKLVALGYFEGPVLAGFCFAGIFYGAVGGFVKRYKRLLIVAILKKPWLIFDSDVRQRLATGVKILFRKKRQAPSSRSKAFSILSIAVDPEIQGKGIGRKLVAATEVVCKDWHYSRIHLTVHERNVQAVEFYRRLGFSVEKAHQGELEMNKELSA